MEPASLPVEGLSLPEGSVRRSPAEFFKQLKADFQASEPGSKVLVLAFDNASGWDSVYSHIDGCMKKAGYPELTELYEAEHKGRRKQIEGHYEGDLLRTYESESLPCSVTLFNFGAMRKLEAYAGSAQGEEAEFALLIVR